MNVYYLSVLSYMFTYKIAHFQKKKKKHLHFQQVSLARGPGNFLVHWCSSALGNLPIPNSYISRKLSIPAVASGKPPKTRSLANAAILPLPSELTVETIDE